MSKICWGYVGALVLIVGSFYVYITEGMNDEAFMLASSSYLVALSSMFIEQRRKK